MVLLYVNTIFAQNHKKPGWLDTIPPVITVKPSKRYLSTPFYISLEANEDAVITYGINSSENMEKYEKGITISKAGKSVVYFYAEDMYGNKSTIDSAVYILDFQRPGLTVTPEPGIYRSKVTVTLSSNEPCRFYRHTDPEGKDTVPIDDTVIVEKRFSGYISAVDRAGNRSRSNELSYVVDTSSVLVSIQPLPGLYNYSFTISFKTVKDAKAYYSFDPNATPRLFTPYFKPVQCPYGLNLVRYFARDKAGRESAIMKARFVVDTIPPKIRYDVMKGKDFDVLTLSAKGKAEIRYAFDNTTSFEDSYIYKEPIKFPHTGRAYVRAVARDEAGNVSKRLVWEYKYDTTPPILHSSHTSGTYTSQFILTIKASEPATIFYTLDNSAPDQNSPVYRDGIRISKKGVTPVRYIGIDEADNRSIEGSLEFMLDFSPPTVRVKIEDGPRENEFYISLKAAESARIHYEIGEKTPTLSSTVYRKKIPMRAGQVLRYFAVDMAGNSSKVYVMGDLQKPIAVSEPKGGVYRRRVNIRFSKTMESDIYFRMLPDTLFTLYEDTVTLRSEGNYTIEYYSQSRAGYKSPIRREQYLLDWTPPSVKISVKKGLGDSVSVFLECSENASIYYTIDGTSPFFSKTTRAAGNKFTKSKDRISIHRGHVNKLAFYAEDAAGNQGAISVVDIFKPRVIPSIPSSKKKVYDRILSLSLNTYDDRSQIYYERHGRMPTMESPIFKEPITLLHSDTINAFVVDASGYHGRMDTFVYLIDLPPSPHCTVAPEITDLDREITFNASGTLDYESSLRSLTFLWDFDGDGTVDVRRKGEPVVTHLFEKPGKYTAILTVVDPMKHSAEVHHEIFVRGICPDNMVFVPREEGRSFCIDRYEWPNRKGKVPMVEVSWIRAEMYCYDEGKRLCTADEWQYACSGRKQRMIKGGGILGRYPYGSQYEEERCPTKGEKIFKSGQFDTCKEKFGTSDMVGNVWEWVSDKRNGAPTIMGGSFKYGNKAHCGFSSESSLIEGSQYTGFRCCR